MRRSPASLQRSQSIVGTPSMSNVLCRFAHSQKPQRLRVTLHYPNMLNSVLEIGCSDGAWCLNFKRENPEWIVEGIDDTNHWSCVEKDHSIRYV